MTTNTNCPKCGHPRQKTGFAWRGRQKVQSYRCTNPSCPEYGKRTTRQK